jgi:hypothetical protein
MRGSLASLALCFCACVAAGCGSSYQQAISRESGEHARRVEFVEHWPLSHPSGSRTKAGWGVTLGRDGGVRSIHVFGHPPQLWR